VGAVAPVIVKFLQFFAIHSSLNTFLNYLRIFKKISKLKFIIRSTKQLRSSC